MKSYKLSFGLLISALIAVTSALPSVNGCAIMPYERVEPHQFEPIDITFIPSDLGFDPLLKRYLFETHPEGVAEYNWNVYGEDELKSINLKEWKAFVGGAYADGDLEQIIYEEKTQTLLNLATQLNSKKKPATPKNTFLNYLAEHRLTPVLAYLIYAKNCEPYVTYDGWGWDFEAEIKQKRNPQKMQTLITNGLQNYQKTPSAFLKLRYAYQVIRLANYAQKYADCVRYYDQLIPGLKIDSIYKYHALRHKAGALFNLNQKADYLAISSIIFDQCPILMNRVLTEDFFLPEPSVWNQTLQRLPNRHQQATLWLLRAFKNESRIDLEPLQQMYELEPNSPRLEFLMIRHLNLIEKNLVNSNFFFPSLSADPAAIPYIQDFQHFVRSVDINQVRRPALWFMVTGYLDVLLKQYPSAEKCFSIAELRTTNNSILRTIGLLRMVAALAQTDTIAATLETESLPSLRWLAENNDYNHTMIYRSLLILMAQKYFNSGELPKGYSCIAKTGYTNLAEDFLIDYCNHDQLEDIISYLTQSAPEPFDAFIAKNQVYSLDRLYYIQGNRYLNEENLTSAYTSLAKITGTHAKEIPTSFGANYYNPKTGLFRYPKNGFSEYSKYDFVKKVNQLVISAHQEPKLAAVNYYQVANAFFHSPRWKYYYLNTSPYIYFDYSQTNRLYPFFTPAIMEKVSNWDYGYGGAHPARTIAWKYYDHAMRLATDRELAAKCCFLAAASQTRFSGYQEFQPEKYTMSYYYDRLAHEYSDTRFFKDVIKECADLRDYLRSK